jgi:NAD(P)-dependent dehydrogenase (short-subunit alcohol dehydrogenase family)
LTCWSTTPPSTPVRTAGPFDEIEVADWDRVMAVNLRGPWLSAKDCAAARRDGGGAIINGASATVMSGSLLWAHYVASKSALIGLARELGDDGVRVNELAPGFTLTDASRELIEDAETTESPAERSSAPLSRRTSSVPPSSSPPKPAR